MRLKERHNSVTRPGDEVAVYVPKQGLPAVSKTSVSNKKKEPRKLGEVRFEDMF
jgi:hypothetical protein